MKTCASHDNRLGSMHNCPFFALFRAQRRRILQKNFALPADYRFCRDNRGRNVPPPT